MQKKGVEIWDLVEMLLLTVRTILLFGPPGTGKSYAGHTMQMSNRELFTLTLTEDTPAAELRGHYIPKGQEFVWQDGPVIKAWRQGGRLVINEINHAGGDVMSFLHAALDTPETARLTLPTGEMVVPSKDFQIVATMNGHPDELPDALRDRFPVAIEIPEPHPAGIASLPEDLREIARNTAVAPIERRISLRQWLAFAALRTHVGERDAAFSVFGHRADEIMTTMSITISG